MYRDPAPRGASLSSISLFSSSAYLFQLYMCSQFKPTDKMHEPSTPPFPLIIIEYFEAA